MPCSPRVVSACARAAPSSAASVRRTTATVFLWMAHIGYQRVLGGLASARSPSGGAVATVRTKNSEEERCPPRRHCAWCGAQHVARPCWASPAISGLARQPQSVSDCRTAPLLTAPSLDARAKRDSRMYRRGSRFWVSRPGVQDSNASPSCRNKKCTLRHNQRSAGLRPRFRQSKTGATSRAVCN